MNKRSKSKAIQKVDYFAGCTANYLFPEVPKAVVEVLRSNDIEVHYPEQIVTDCLSCRLQFKQLLPYLVYHPIEILKQAYKTDQSGVSKEDN